jgi:hypothetical protein
MDTLCHGAEIKQAGKKTRHFRGPFNCMLTAEDSPHPENPIHPRDQLLEILRRELLNHPLDFFDRAHGAKLPGQQDRFKL